MGDQSQSATLLSIADIARHFSLPESTARYYCKRFAQYIPSIGEGRRKRYRPETLEVIQTILDQMQKSRTAAAVDEALDTLFPRNALAVSESSVPTTRSMSEETSLASPPVLQLMERQTMALEGIFYVLQDSLQSMNAQNTANKENIASVQKEVKTLKMLLEASEKTHQADIEQLRQWMGKMLRSQKRTNDK